MLKQFISLIILGAILFVFYSEFRDTPFVNTAELNATREDAVKLAKQGNYQEALPIFEALVDVAPDNKEIWGDYLIALIWAGQGDKAYQLAKQNRIDLIPGYALSDVFGLVITKSDPEFAYLVARQDLSTNADPLNVAISRANDLNVNGFTEQADKLLLESSQYMTQEDYDVIDIMLLNRSDSFAAQARIKNKLNSNATIHDSLWIIYKDYWVEEARQGNVAEAVSNLAPYVGAAPNDSNLVQDYFVLLSWNDKFDDAVDLYDSSLAVSDNSEYVDAAAANALYRVGRLDESKKLYQSLLVKSPDNYEYKKGLAKVYVDLNMPNQAIAILHPTSALLDNDGRLIVGLAQQKLNQNQEALSSLSSALHAEHVQDDRAYMAWLESFKNELKKTPYSKLWARYSVPLKSAPDWVRKELEQIQKAKHKKPYKTKASHYVDYKSLARSQAANARQQGRSRKAITLYKKALALEPGDRDLRLGLALALIDAGETQQSQQLLKELAEENPRDKQVMDAFVYYGQQFLNRDIWSKYLRKLAQSSNGEEKNAYLNSWLNLIRNKRFYPTLNGRIKELSKYPSEGEPIVVAEKAGLFFLAGRCEQANAEINKISVSMLNAEQLESLAYISRRCGNNKMAYALYEHGTNKYSDNPIFYSGAILTAVNNKQSDKAEQLINCCYEKFDDDFGFTIAAAYFYFNQGNFENSYDLYNKALTIRPTDSEALSGMFMSMAELGNAEVAYNKIKEEEIKLNQQQWKRLYDLRVKQMLILAVNEEGPYREELANRALDIIEEYQVYLKAEYPIDKNSMLSSNLNKVHAYNLAGEPARAVATYEAMNVDVDDIPVWGVLRIAEAYSQNNQPKQAIDLLEMANIKQPNDLNLLSMMLFVYMDLEDYDNANKVMADMNTVVNTGRVKGSQVHWVDRLDAMFQAYQNRLREAEKRLHDLKEKSPDDIEINKNLATVYRWQGLFEKSKAEIEQARSKKSDDIAIAVSQANLLMDSNNHQEAEKIVTKVSSQYSYRSDVKRLVKKWDAYNKRQYTARAQYGKSSGNALGNKDFTFEHRLYSSPINNNYRLYIRDRYDWAEFDDSFETNGNLHRVGVGAEYNSSDFFLSAEINASVRDDTDAGVALNGVWKSDDHLSVFGNLQTYSRNVPLRAINAGIDGESIGAGVQYRWNESRFLRASGSFTDFSDGNERSSFYLVHEHDIYQSAHHQIYLSEEFYASHNSLDDAGYYNPESDYSFRLATKYHGILWREYDDSLTHRLIIGVGNYKQDGESNAAIWDLEYQHKWIVDDLFEVNYGYLHRRRTYDGDAESYNAVTGSLNWRF